ncbi:MAG: cytochrome c biogenesis protein ResB [Thermodesulfobacteriota bacterium]
MKRVWRLLASTELTIILAILICLDAAWGSLITVRHRDLFQSLDHAILFQWLASYGKANIGKTLWIYLLIILITLFALNAVLCTVERIFNIIVYRRPWRSLYPQIVHIGFLIALVGHLMGSAYGFRSQGNLVHQGETIPVPQQEGLSLRLDAIETATSPRGELESLTTTVTLFQEGKALLTDTIKLNDPLRYRGIAFYHVDHGAMPTGLILGTGDERFNIPFGESFETAEGTRFTLGRIIPDFAIDPSGIPYSRSNAFRNPHQEIISSHGARGWLPLRQPGTRVKVGNNTIVLHDYSIGRYAVLNINRDPGIGLIIAGSTVLVIGMLLLLFLKGNRVELIQRFETSR